MAFGQQPLDSGGVPISSGYVANSGFNAIGASTLVQTDTLGNTYTSPNFNLQQIGMTAIQMGGTDGATAANMLYLFAGLWNGLTADRPRGNLDTGALITASAVTTTQTGADQTNINGRGLKVVLNMTNVGTGSVTLEIDGKDTASGNYYAILTGAAVITNSLNVYTIYPGIAAVANVSASDLLPRTWRVKAVANNANATSFTVAASVIV